MDEATCRLCGGVLDRDTVSCRRCGALRVDRAIASEPLVVLATFPQVHLGHLARSLLESRGVVAILSDEHLAGLLALAGDGGVKLRVRRDQLALAREILTTGADDEPCGAAAAGHEAPIAGAVCPSCGSGSITRLQALPSDGFGASVRAFLQRALGMRWACLTCRARW